MMVEATPHPVLPCKSPSVTRHSSTVCSNSCGQATGPHGSGLSSTPASGFGGWQGRCCVTTPKSIGGRRPTTCSWRRSVRLHRCLGDRPARIAEALLQSGGDPDPASSHRPCPPVLRSRRTGQPSRHGGKEPRRRSTAEIRTGGLVGRTFELGGMERVPRASRGDARRRKGGFQPHLVRADDA